MQQELQESRIEESVVAEPVAISPVPTGEVATGDGPTEQVLVEPPTAPNWLRLAFALEFLVAMQTSFAVWAQVGGQGHLDLLPWYAKLLLTVALSYGVVKLTAAAVNDRAAWNRRSRGWLLMICGIAALMAMITYYYHLHESLDDPDSDENSTTSVCNAVPGAVVFPA